MLIFSHSAFSLPHIYREPKAFLLFFSIIFFSSSIVVNMIRSRSESYINWIIYGGVRAITARIREAERSDMKYFILNLSPLRLFTVYIYLFVSVWQIKLLKWLQSINSFHVWTAISICQAASIGAGQTGGDKIFRMERCVKAKWSNDFPSEFSSSILTPFACQEALTSFRSPIAWHGNANVASMHRVLLKRLRHDLAGLLAGNRVDVLSVSTYDLLFEVFGGDRREPLMHSQEAFRN